MKRIIIFGASGMLGGMLTEYFSTLPGYQVFATVRDIAYRDRMKSKLPGVTWVQAGADFQNYTTDFAAIPACDFIINAVGITKPLIKDDNPTEVQRAIWINSVLPHVLGQHAAKLGARVLQIATDCVYSGEKGSYVESDPHDPRDVYGRTKSLGECYLPNVHHLRCSIIGPEFKERRFLIEWFLAQPRGATVKGFRNHTWNGVTTLHFAKFCQGIIEQNITLPHLQHIIPHNLITKAEMLQSFAEAYGRQDIKIDVVDATSRVDRTLQTSAPELNSLVWKAVGYVRAPGVSEMIHELSRFKLRTLESSGERR